MKLTNTTKTILAILFLLITFWPISAFQYTMKFDMINWFYPMRFLVGECLQNNILPTWNPYTNLGYPLHIDPQSGALYPFTWIIGWLFGYNIYTINLEFILHIILGFYGMKKLAMALDQPTNIAIVVGLSYACCGFFVGNAQHLSWIISAAWLPFMACYYIKMIRFNSWRDALWLAVFSCLLLTGGYPAFTITIFYLMGIAFVIRSFSKIKNKDFKYLKKFVVNNCIFVAAFLLQSLVFLKFFLESLPLLLRTESLSLTNVQLLPFSPQAYSSFILPFMTGGNSKYFDTDISMANGYFGIIALIFVLFYLFKNPTRKSLTLWTIGLFFLLAAMGDYFYLREALYHYVPMMNLFRYPSLFRIFSLISFLLLLGFSMQGFLSANFQKFNFLKIRILCFLLLSFLTGIFFYNLQNSELILPEHFTAAAISDFFNKSNNAQMILIQAPIQILLVSLLLIKTFLKRGMSFLKFAFLLLFFDLFISVQMNTFLTVASDMQISTLQKKLDILPDGFPIPTEDILSTSHNGSGRKYAPIWFNQNIFEKKIAFDGYNNFSLKAFHAYKKQKGNRKFLKRPLLFDSSNTAQDSVLSESNSEILITAFSPNKITAKVSMKNAGELTLLQHYYPDWKITVDKKEVKGFMKRDFFIGLNIPEGKHEIVYEFSPKYFSIYLLISFLSFIFFLAYLSVYELKIIFQRKS